MTIASQLVEAYNNCPTKCWLMSRREPISDDSYAQWARARNQAYVASGIQRLLSGIHHEEYVISPSADGMRAGKWRLAVNVVTRTQHLESHLHAVERLPSRGRGKPALYSSMRFVPNVKLGKDTRLLLAFDALALAELSGQTVTVGKVIHGDDYTMATVRISPLLGEVQKRLEEMTALLSSPAPPDPILIRHCAECEFQARCRQKALEKDDLSLLSGMTELCAVALTQTPPRRNWRRRSSQARRRWFLGFPGSE
jgi:predicted RecB family nuclease